MKKTKVTIDLTYSISFNVLVDGDLTDGENYTEEIRQQLIRKADDPRNWNRAEKTLCFTCFMITKTGYELETID